MACKYDHNRIAHHMMFSAETLPAISDRVLATSTVKGLLPHVVANGINELHKKVSRSNAHVLAYNAVCDFYQDTSHFRDYCQICADLLTWHLAKCANSTTAISETIQKSTGLFVAKIITLYPFLKSLIGSQLVDAAIQNLSTLNEIQAFAANERSKENISNTPTLNGDKKMFPQQQAQPQVFVAQDGQQYVQYNGQCYTMQQWALLQQQMQQQQQQQFQQPQMTVGNTGFGMPQQTGFPMVNTAGIPSIGMPTNVINTAQTQPQIIMANDGQQYIQYNGQYYTMQQWALLQQQMQQQQQQSNMVQLGGNVFGGMPQQNTFPGNGINAAIPSVTTMGSSFATPQQQQVVQNNTGYFSSYDVNPPSPHEVNNPFNHAPAPSSVPAQSYEIHPNLMTSFEPVHQPTAPEPLNIQVDMGPSSTGEKRIEDTFGVPFKTVENHRPMHKTLINNRDYVRVWDDTGKEYLVERENLMNRDDHTIPLMGGTIDFDTQARAKAFEREINNMSKLNDNIISEARTLVNAGEDENMTPEAKELIAQVRDSFIIDEEVVGNVDTVVTTLRAEQAKNKTSVTTGTAYIVHAEPTRIDNEECWMNIKTGNNLVDIGKTMQSFALAYEQTRHAEKIKGGDYADSLVWLNNVDKYMTERVNEFFRVHFDDINVYIDSFMHDIEEAHRHVMSTYSEVYRTIWNRFDRAFTRRLRSMDGVTDVQEYIKSISAANGDATFSYHTEHVSVTSLNVLYAELGITIEKPLSHKVDAQRNPVLYKLLQTVWENIDTLVNDVDSTYIVTRDNVKIKAHRSYIDNSVYFLSLV